MPTSRSQSADEVVHSGSASVPGRRPIPLRFTVDAPAANPQRAGAIQDSWDRPFIPLNGSTPPDRMTWNMVSITRNGIAFSDVLTKADTSRPRHAKNNDREADTREC